MSSIEHSPILHYNGPATRLSEQSTRDEEAAFLRAIQNFHMDDASTGWADIAYNFAVAPSGRIYELRGLKIANAANGVSRVNRKSHTIFLAIGEGQVPTEQMVRSVRSMRVFLNAIKVKGHSDVFGTECPGGAIGAMIASKTFNSAPDDPVEPIDAPDPEPLSSVLKWGSRGRRVATLQSRLGIEQDGDFGDITEAAVKGFQTSQGISVDGIAGPHTQRSLNDPNPAFRVVESSWLPQTLSRGSSSSEQLKALTRVWTAAVTDRPRASFDRVAEGSAFGFQAGVPTLDLTGTVDSRTWGTRFAGAVTNNSPVGGQ